MYKRILFSLCLVGAASSSQLLAQEPDTLADHLPANTLVYFEIPDVQGLIEDAQTSSLGRIWNDPEVKGFMDPLVAMLGEGMGMARQQAEASGIPADLLSWEALTTVQAGLAMSATGGSNAYEPALVASVAIGFKEGLSDAVFGLLSAQLGSELGATVEESEYGPMLMIPFEGETIQLLNVEDHLVLWAELGTVGDGASFLSGAPQFQAAKAGVVEEGTAFFLYADMGSFMDTMMQIVEQQGEAQATQLMGTMWEKLGLTSLGTMAMSSGWRDGASVGKFTMSFRGDGPKGVFQMQPGNVDLGLLDYVPDNATSFSLYTDHSTADPWAVMDGMISEVVATPAMDNATVGDLWQQSGHSSWDWFRGEKSQVFADGIRGFGKNGFSYSITDESAMMSMGGQAASFVQVTDVNAVRTLLSEFVPQMMEWMSEGGVEVPISIDSKSVSIRERNDAGELVTRQGPEYFVMKIDASVLPAEMAQMGFLLAQIQPSFGVTDDGWMVFSMNSGDVRRYLRTGVTKPDANIRDNADVASFLDRLPANTSSVSWSDPRPAVGGAVTMLQNFVPMIASQIPDEVPIDLNQLPGPDPFVNNLRPTEVVTYMDGNTVVAESVGSFDLADLLVIGGAALAVAPMAMMQAMPQEQAWEAPAVIEVEDGAETVAIDSGSAAAAKRELERIRTGLIVYQIENNSWPASISDLTKPTELYPFGFLPEDNNSSYGLNQDPWGNAFKLKTEGNDYVIWSCGPNGVDDGGKGDDIALDG